MGRRFIFLIIASVTPMMNGWSLITRRAV